MSPAKSAALLFLVAGLVLPARVGSVPEVIAGPVPAQVIDVIDGDTIVVKARIWLGHDVETRIRLDGVDAPELKGKCESERLMAVAARALVAKLVEGGRVVLRDIQYGKYAGRVVARVETPTGTDFSRALLQAGLGRAYDGRRRASWCDDPVPK
jgi:endonuclease YncB( thermonuclease family)